MSLHPRFFKAPSFTFSSLKTPKSKKKTFKFTLKHKTETIPRKRALEHYKRTIRKKPSTDERFQLMN